MSYSMYTLYYAFAVQDCQQWQYAIQFLEDEIQRKKGNGACTYPEEVVKEQFNNCMAEGKTTLLSSIAEDEVDNCLHDLISDFGAPVPLDFFVGICKAMKSHHQKAVYFGGVDIDNSNSDPEMFVIFEINYGFDIKEVNKKWDWTSIQHAMSTCNVRLTNDRRNYLKDFPGAEFDFTRLDVTAPIIDNSLSGMVFAATGSNYYFKSREELKRTIESHGGKLGSSVTAKTNYLIANSYADTTKHRMAFKLGIPVITEKEYLSMFLGSDSN